MQRKNKKRSNIGLEELELLYLNKGLTKYEISKPKDVLIIPYGVWKRYVHPLIKILEMVPDEVKR